MLSYNVIYYEKFRKIIQRTEKEALNIAIAMKTISCKGVSSWLPTYSYLNEELLVGETFHGSIIRIRCLCKSNVIIKTYSTLSISLHYIFKLNCCHKRVYYFLLCTLMTLHMQVTFLIL